MADTFKTVKADQKISIEIKKSIFIVHVTPVKTEQSAQDFIQHIQKTYSDAAHNVFAYRVGVKSERARQSDDGEPAGTAGKPVLEVLEQEALTNTVIVITRYFGGIKLGASGLIRAYRSSAAKGIASAGKVTRSKHRLIETEIGYSELGKMRHKMANHPRWTLKKIHYKENVKVVVAVPVGETGPFMGFLNELTDGSAKFTKKEIVFL